MATRPTPAPVTITDIDRMPVMLGADLVMGIYLKRSYAALLRDVHLGHVPPPKFQRPMRWHKPDIKAHFANPRKFKRKTSRKPS
jgi:hypothetical protein